MNLNSEIVKLVKSPTNSKVIESLGITVINWLELPKYKNIEDICPCILFIPVESINNGHYGSLWMTNNILYYFCSYGYSIMKDVSKSMYLNETPQNDEDYLNNLINKFIGKGGKIQINHTRYQGMNDDISTCARYCIIRLLKKDLNHDQFKSWFMFKNIKPDELISLLTYII